MILWVETHGIDKKTKVTWQLPRSKHWHMIDYIIVRRQDLKDLYSVWAMRGADCWTDHPIEGQIGTQNSPKTLTYHFTTPKTTKCIFVVFSWNNIYFCQCN